MSSFVISKEEFIKAAGFVAGLAAEMNYYREPVIRIWNRDKGCICEDSDFYDMFCEIYKLNAESVQKQYRDSKAESDSEEYKDVFLASKSKAHKLYMQYICDGSKKLKIAVAEFNRFAHSVNYQIEDDECADKANSIMNPIIIKMYEIFDRELGELESWGSFELDHINADDRHIERLW